jgi:Family of unknown function (DUF6165)
VVVTVSVMVGVSLPVTAAFKLRLVRPAPWLAPVFDQIAIELRKIVPANLPTKSVVIETAPGELIDKITILEIKSERIADPEKLGNVRTELERLRSARDRTILPCDELAQLATELRSINEALWEIEDQIRDCERSGEFGDRFITLARSVYQQNDRRAAIKRRINERLGSEIIEEKSYRSTGTDQPAP